MRIFRFRSQLLVGAAALKGGKKGVFMRRKVFGEPQMNHHKMKEEEERRKEEEEEGEGKEERRRRRRREKEKEVKEKLEEKRTSTCLIRDLLKGPHDNLLVPNVFIHR